MTLRCESKLLLLCLQKILRPSKVRASNNDTIIWHWIPVAGSPLLYPWQWLCTICFLGLIAFHLFLPASSFTECWALITGIPRCSTLSLSPVNPGYFLLALVRLRRNTGCWALIERWSFDGAALVPWHLWILATFFWLRCTFIETLSAVLIIRWCSTLSPENPGYILWPWCAVIKISSAIKCQLPLDAGH